MSERTRTRRTAAVATPAPAGVDPETGEMAPGAEIPPERAIVFLDKDIADLDRAQDALMELQLTNEAAVAAFFYAFEDRQTRGKWIIGPSADFVMQLVRQLNRASKGKVNLRLLPEAPIVQDFTAIDGQGKVRPYVRVIVGVEDTISGERSFGIKAVPRVGTDPEGNAHTRAIRRAFEVHPLYNRKKVSQFIRRKMRSLGMDLAAFTIAGEGGGGGTWSEVFGRARAAGVSSDAVRQGVRDQTGQGLSQVRDAAAAGAAAVAADATIAQGPREGDHPGVEGARQPPTPAPTAEQPAAATQTLAEASPTPATPGTPPAKLIASQEATRETAGELTEEARLKAKIRDHITHLGLKPGTVNTLWGQVTLATPPDVEDFRRMLTVLQLIATGTDKDQAVIQALKEDRRDTNPFA